MCNVKVVACSDKVTGKLSPNFEALQGFWPLGTYCFGCTAHKLHSDHFCFLQKQASVYSTKYLINIHTTHLAPNSRQS